MRLTIAEDEVGVIVVYKYIECASFVSLNSSIYINYFGERNPDLKKCTFAEFKKLYPVCKNTNLRSKK